MLANVVIFLKKTRGELRTNVDFRKVEGLFEKDEGIF